MTQVDTTNTDKFYWEKILAESNLSSDKEAQQVFVITAEECRELENVGLLPEEDYERQDDPVITFNGITKDTDILNADHSGLGETNEELRTKIDGSDTFFEGHRIIKQRRGNAGNKTGVPRTCPDWAKDNAKIRALLLRSFPKLLTDEKQRLKAGRWARVIQMYYRSQMTHGQICNELDLTLPTILSMIRNIDRVVKGKRADGRGNLSGKVGRPKKVML